MRRLVDGMAGWATYYQACAGGRHYDEHLFYQHIDQIAQGRRWRVSQQHALAVPPRRGAPPSIDFVMYREPGYADSRAGLAFVEVKYLRGDNPSQDLAQLRRDIEKLRALTPHGLINNHRLLRCGDPAKFLLIFAQEAGLDAIASCTSRINGKIAKLIVKARHGDHKSIYRASMVTYLREPLEWVVIAIAEPRWPH